MIWSLTSSTLYWIYDSSSLSQEISLSTTGLGHLSFELHLHFPLLEATPLIWKIGAKSPASDILYQRPEWNKALVSHLPGRHVFIVGVYFQIFKAKVCYSLNKSPFLSTSRTINKCVHTFFAPCRYSIIMITILRNFSHYTSWY
jgi:hypothetical protein